MADETTRAPSPEPSLEAETSPKASPLGRGPLASALAKAQAGGLLGALRGPAHRAPAHAFGPQGKPATSPVGPQASVAGTVLTGPGPVDATTTLPTQPAAPRAGGQQPKPGATFAPSVRGSLAHGGELNLATAEASTAANSPEVAQGGAAAPARRQAAKAKTPDLRTAPERNDDILPSSPRRLLRLPVMARFSALVAAGRHQVS